MTRFKCCFAAVVVAAIVAVVPVANAQTFHFVAAGSSAQWQMAGLAADQLALNQATATSSGNSVCHWTASSGTNVGALVNDDRDQPLNRIEAEPGNIWIVWSQNIPCSQVAATENTATVTDLWVGVSVDSTVGVRAFSAPQVGATAGPGAIVTLGSLDVAGTAGKGKIQAALWPDNGGLTTADTPIPTATVTAVNTGGSLVGGGGGTGGIHVNVGMTDIRPEDALFATVRSITALNTTTYAGLGYVGPTSNIGAPIYTNSGLAVNAGTGTTANPVRFGLSGKVDPFNTANHAPTYTTIPIGAAPIVFIANNGTGAPLITNITTGIVPDVAQPAADYLASLFFGGEENCDTNDLVFGGPGDGAGTPLTIFLREPLSGTENTTEYSLFRSVGNTKGSQETGVVNPTRAPYNPLALTCTSGHGLRSRAIGTGEVVGSASPAYGLLGTPSSIGYIFYGFANAAKLTPVANFNYLTLDGVDPIYDFTSDNPLPQQELPACGTSTQPSCPALTEWPATAKYPAGFSFPNLRNGTYKAWSVYRWLIANSNINSDPYGYDQVAITAQNYVDQDVADFVPYVACSLTDPNCQTTAPVDGLSVYHSHFTQETIAGKNGYGTLPNQFGAAEGYAGNTLLAGECTPVTSPIVTCTNTPQCVTRTANAASVCAFVEAGGDEGGFIEGPFGQPTAVAGTVEIHTSLTAGKGYEIQWKTGTKFTAGTPWEGQTLNIGGNNYTVANVTVTATVLYITTKPTGTNLSIVSDSGTLPGVVAVFDGVISKHQ
jgi:hypothetical protein